MRDCFAHEPFRDILVSTFPNLVLRVLSLPPGPACSLEKVGRKREVLGNEVVLFRDGLEVACVAGGRSMIMKAAEPRKRAVGFLGAR